MKNILSAFAVTSFRARLNIIFLGAILSISIFIYVYFPRTFQQNAFDTARSNAKTISDIAAYSTAPAVYFNDHDALQDILTYIRLNSDIRFIVITDQKLKIISGYDIDAGLRLKYDISTHDGFITEDQSTVMSRSTIQFNNITIGYLYVGLSLDSILDEVKETKWNITLISGIILMIGLAIVFIVSRLLISPIELMAKTFESVDHGEISQKFTISGFKEIKTLAQAFNRMVDDLASAQKELRSVNRTLEQRIDERTKDLMQEIRQHKVTEGALRESEERFRALVELSPDAIIVHSEEKFSFINTPALVMFRVYSAEKMIGRSLFDFMSPESAKQLNESLNQILHGTSINVFSEYVFLRDDGSEFTAEVVATKLVFRGKIAIQIVIRDISERIRNERARMELEQQLLHVQKKEIISTLASGLAHDILNILGIIGTSINKLLFLKNLDQESLLESADQISKASERGKSLVRQLLSFARKSELNFDSISINTVVSEIISVIQRIFPTAITIKSDLAPGLPVIRADHNQMHQALLNLCLNARDAIPESGLIMISTTAATKPSLDNVQGEFICICVSDDGAGMSEEVQRKIYEPFFTTKSEGTGSGLGLPMVKGIMENHRGYIEIDSAVGKGTTFRLFFPV